MAELGSTTDPTALVPGDPAAVRADAGVLDARATALEDAADALAAVRTPGWTGLAADAFAGVMSAQPRSWRVTADAMTAAAAQLTGFADALAAAQSTAADAVEAWAAAQEETTRATTEYNSRVAAYNSALRTAQSGRTTVVPSRPGPFADPGAAGRAEATALLEDARDAVRRAGDDAVHVLTGIVVSDRPVVTSQSGTEVGATEGSTSGPLITFDDEGNMKIGLASVDGSVAWFTASAGTEARYGSWFAKAEADFQVLSAEGSAAAGLEDGNLYAEASGSAALVRGSASASAGGRYGHVGAEAEGYVGAYAEAGVQIGADGIGASAGGFVGGKAEVGVDVELAGVGAGLNAEAWAGVGAEADVGITQNDDGSWTIGVKAGVAVGVGGSIEPEITVDPQGVMDALEDAADWIGSQF